jgi:DNA-binding MarR family transcriptional regulator
MNRLELLQHLAKETRSAAIAYNTYMYMDREYVRGQKLHLREMHFLVEVGAQGSLSMTEIAERLEISQGAATQISSRLLRKALITKTKSYSDKRYVAIELTPLGRRVFTEYLEYDREQRALVNARFDEFSDGELQVILRYEIILRDLARDFMAANAHKNKKP